VKQVYPQQIERDSVMADVFLSYSRNDRDAAHEVATALEAVGLSVWWDREILGGENFDEAIERELDLASAVIVLWSKHSATSGWVRSEAAAAAERHVLVPVFIEQVKLPLEFRRKHTIDLSSWRGDPNAHEFGLILRAIASHLPQGATRLPILPSSASKTQQDSRSGPSGRGTAEAPGLDPAMGTPVGFLGEAIRRLPVLAWAIGVGGVVAIGVIVSTWKPSPVVAIFGSLGLFVGMFGLFIFSALVAPSHVTKPPPFSLFVLWAFSILLVITGFLAASSLFFDSPVALRTLLFPTKPIATSEPSSSSVVSSANGALTTKPDTGPELRKLLPAPADEGLPRLFLLAVGINDYGHPAINRHSAIASVNAIASLFARQKHRAFGEVEAVVITGSNATQANILRAMRTWGRTAGDNDLAIAFLAGRSGVFTTDNTPGRFAFMCFDSDDHEPERTGISGEAILDLSANIACPKLVIIDTPTYGGIHPQEARDATPSTEVKRLPALDIMVASWSGGQPETSFGQSLFSKALLDGLGLAGDANHDGIVTTGELWDYMLKHGPRDAALTTPLRFRELNPMTVLVRIP
jgi:hypothetical protein